MILDFVSGLTCRLLDERERAVVAMIDFLSQSDDLKMYLLIIILSTDFFSQEVFLPRISLICTDVSKKSVRIREIRG